jgi:hypothetical protein
MERLKLKRRFTPNRGMIDEAIAGLIADATGRRGRYGRRPLSVQTEKPARMEYEGRLKVDTFPNRE